MNRARQHQTGFTLLELMVSLVIASVTALVAIQLHVMNRLVYLKSTNLAEMHGNTRIATFLFMDAIRRAGDPIGDGDVSNYRSACTGALGTPLTGCDQATGCTVAGQPTNGDSITINYESNTDCLGQAVAGGIVTDTYFVADNNLQCQGGGGGNPEIIVNDIENMQVLFGIDTNNDDSVNQYVTAGNTGGSPVLALRLGLLFRSTDPIMSSADDTNIYDLAGTQVGPDTHSSGKYGRIAMNVTVALRSCLH